MSATPAQPPAAKAALKQGTGAAPRPTPRKVPLRDILASALTALWVHRTRTLLTATSMVIANASVIIVVSIALTGRDFVLQQIEGVGSNLIYAYFEAGERGSRSETDFINLADVDAVRDQLGDLGQAVAGVMTIYDRIFIEGAIQQIRILGSNEEYRIVRNLRMPTGRFFDSDEVDRRAKVCLLTEPLARKLFRTNANALGQTIKVQGLNFTVVGVFVEGVDTFGQTEVAPYSVLIPITVMKYFHELERVDPLYVSVQSQTEVDRVTTLIEELLVSRHRSGSTYRVENLAGILTAAKNIATALTIVLILVAGITLFISGIFIMNIMLVSVIERTKEIGIRMAIGATRQQVQKQFLLEAICISMMGGLVGAAVGIAVPVAAGRLLPQLNIPVSPIAIVVALAVSGTVGAVFGLLPAYRAAKLDPVEALRYE